MQLLRVLNLIERFVVYLARQVWSLAKRILMNPLGFIWWAFKMYIVLMLAFMCLAFSFGSFAAAGDPDWAAGGMPPKKSVSWTCSGANSAGVIANFSGNSASECIGNYVSYYNATAPKDVNNGSGGKYSLQLALLSCTEAGACSMRETRTTVHPTYGTSQTFTNFQKGANKGPETKTCPPENPYAGDTTWQQYILGPFVKPGDTTGAELCWKPTGDNACWADGSASQFPLMHFDASKAGQDLVCVVDDTGKKCPFKAQGKNGIFVPAVDSPNACNETPPPPDSDEEPPEQCMPGGNGMEVCPADPNDKCKPAGDKLPGQYIDCPAGCGFMNGKFMCYTEPDIPDLPDLPDADKPDDNITDPNKPLADMLKKDFKDIQKGMESRLDGVQQLLKNNNAISKAQFDALKKNGDTGNKLLNSINQNTADTVDELKKLTGKDGPKPEYGEIDLGESNDWASRNFGTVMSAAGQKILEKPIFTAVQNFFSASFGGSCPSWSVSVWVFDVTLDQFCSDGFQSVLPGIRAIIILIFSFLAFRVAFLD